MTNFYIYIYIDDSDHSWTFSEPLSRLPLQDPPLLSLRISASTAFPASACPAPEAFNELWGCPCHGDNGVLIETGMVIKCHPFWEGSKKCHAKFLGIGLVICHEPLKKTDRGGGG